MPKPIHQAVQRQADAPDHRPSGQSVEQDIQRHADRDRAKHPFARTPAALHRLGQQVEQRQPHHHPAGQPEQQVPPPPELHGEPPAGIGRSGGGDPQQIRDQHHRAAPVVPDARAPGTQARRRASSTSMI
jgi:hypothetical protein